VVATPQAYDHEHGRRIMALVEARGIEVERLLGNRLIGVRAETAVLVPRGDRRAAAVLPHPLLDVTLCLDQFVDVPVRRPEVLPRRPAVIKDLNAGGPQFGDGRGQVPYGKTADRTGGEMRFVVFVEKLHVTTVRQGENPEAGLFVSRPQAEHLAVEIGHFPSMWGARAEPPQSDDVHGTIQQHHCGTA
jgi:hypothetical protein